MEYESVESWKCFIKDITEEDVKIIGIYKFYFIKLNSLQNNINLVWLINQLDIYFCFISMEDFCLLCKQQNYSLRVKKKLFSHMVGPPNE